MNIKVVGTGCTKCNNTVALIDQVAKAKGVSFIMEKIEEWFTARKDGLYRKPQPAVRM